MNQQLQRTKPKDAKAGLSLLLVSSQVINTTMRQYRGKFKIRHNKLKTSLKFCWAKELHNISRQKAQPYIYIAVYPPKFMWFLAHTRSPITITSIHDKEWFTPKILTWFTTTACAVYKCFFLKVVVHGWWYHILLQIILETTVRFNKEALPYSWISVWFSRLSYLSTHPADLLVSVVGWVMQPEHWA